MANKITGKEYPLRKIFSSDFDFHIPAYQRPYAWTKEEAATMFDDLYDFYKSEQEENYFLGSIVLIKEDGIPRADVIDGQQRLTTLTILFAAIADLLTGNERKECEGLLKEPGQVLAQIPARPRLYLRDRDQEFFETYIQGIQLDKLYELKVESLPDEAQQHIYENCREFQDKIEKVFQNDKGELISFCSFLIMRCFLVVVYTPTQESAFRIFSVMNSRGMDLLPIDIIKSEIIGKIASGEQQKYTDKWEELEIQATRAGFNDVFTHTRMIYAKSKPKKSLQEEFGQYVIKNVAPKELIDDILTPYTDAYTTLKNKSYVSVGNAKEINSLLGWINKIDNSDWMPVAIKFLAERNNDSEYVLWFMKKLERLAAYLHITACDINRRIERYKWVLEEMERNPDHNLQCPLTQIELTNGEKREFIAALDGEVYRMTPRRRNYVLLRLDSFVSCGGAVYDTNVLTIEHVLPQTVAAGSQWASNWPNIDDRTFWINRIANLVPLTRRHNSEAQNYDFEKKKKTYFMSANGTSSYALTTQVINENEWNPEIVAQRQKDILDTFKKNWELKESAEERNQGKYNLISRGCRATGSANPDRTFKVYKGTQISKNTLSSLGEYLNLRNQLIADGVIVDGVFVQDHDFSSASTAARIITGRSASGPLMWKTIDGRTYGQVMDENKRLSESTE